MNNSKNGSKAVAQQKIRMIPIEVLDEITIRAKNDWPTDKEMQDFCIKEECAAYLNIEHLDFGKAARLKPNFLANAKLFSSSWGDVYENIESELHAYLKIAKFSPNMISQTIVNTWKDQASKEFEDCYTDQFAFLEKKLKKHNEVLEIRRQVDPIKELLIELEQIIGSECHNENIKSHQNWGVNSIDSKKFRYPVNFHNNENESRRKYPDKRIASEELISGHYNFGANQLHIYRALFKAIIHLKEKYKLNI